MTEIISTAEYQEFFREIKNDPALQKFIKNVKNAKFFKNKKLLTDNPKSETEDSQLSTVTGMGS